MKIIFFKIFKIFLKKPSLRMRPLPGFVKKKIFEVIFFVKCEKFIFFIKKLATSCDDYFY